MKEQNYTPKTASATRSGAVRTESIDQKLHKDDVAHKIGDMIERAGEKISNAGAERLGRSVYKVGNKIEHMTDKRK